MQNNEVKLICLHTKINTKWIKNPSIKANTIKFLKENTGQKLHDTGFSNDFLDTILKAQATKEN